MADKRLNVNFSESAYRALEEMASRKGTSMAEVLRDAIALEKWIMEAQEEGSRLLIERPDGSVREVMFR